MNDIETILKQFKSGNISLEDAIKNLRLFSLNYIEGGVTLDEGRHVRKGIPEVIFAERKPIETLKRIIKSHLQNNQSLLLSRVFNDHLAMLKKEFSNQFDIQVSPSFEPYSVLLKTRDFEFEYFSSKIGILTAGTSDLPIAEEAKAIAKLMGVEAVQFHDVGIAGVHRLFEPLRKLVEEDVKAIVVVAGMEGALPAVVSSLVDIPVIGVPCSTGYGYGGKGVGALMTMLQTCSPGLVVVNIDNGINAGATAALIAKQAEKSSSNTKNLSN
ncbi:MAG: nickel pincer cofactor biosynthesis protein LarB [Candidatus Heimdallarchaeota archaeon]